MKSTDEIMQERLKIVQEAETWIGTPFHHNACVKGAGVDCMHLVACYEVVLGIEFSIPQNYSPQWHLHENITMNGDPEIKEIYLEGIIQSGFIQIEKDKVQPGDIVLAKLARVFAHAGMITNWPYVIQAESSPMGAGKVVKVNANANWFLSKREVMFFSRKEWHVI